MSYVDLHTHSTASDGTFSPREVVRAAVEAGLTGLALTDHDTIGGVAEAADEARLAGIDFLPGIEISCEFPRPGTLHLLGYGVNPASTVLTELTRRLIDGRTTRNKRMIALLNEAGIDITEEELLAEARSGRERADRRAESQGAELAMVQAGADTLDLGTSDLGTSDSGTSDSGGPAGSVTVGRPHLAALLVRKGYANSTADAFNRFLGQTGKFYVDKETTTSRQAIEMIHQAGGIAVLAHPVQLRRTNDAQLQTTIKSLADEGLDGMEVIHSDHRASLIDDLEVLCRKYGLVPTGGSDFHGGAKPHIRLGYAGNADSPLARRIPRALFDGVLARLAQRVTRSP